MGSRSAPSEVRLRDGVSSFFSREIVTGGLDYFEYQVLVARRVVIPWLAERMALAGVRLADFGCHEGGMLEGFRASPVASGVGFEINEDVVRASPFVRDDRFRIEVGDLTALCSNGDTFDLILLHDVLEHVVDCDGVLAAARRRLADGGRIFVSFPPYWSAYGGHQHLASTWARATPFVHYLPERTFLRLARPADNEYMTGEDSLGDMLSVRRTKLSLRKAERAFAAAGLTQVDAELFLLRPEYSVRYGVPTTRAGVLGRVPGVRELAVNGAFYLLAAA